MSRLLSLLVLLCLVAVPLRAQDRALAQAMQAVRAENWTVALQLAEGDGPAAVDVVRWHALRAGFGTPSAALEFLDQNPDWPGLPYLRRQMEPVFAEARPEETRAFFAYGPPQTLVGAEALAQAYRATGDINQANEVLIEAWRSFEMTVEEQSAFAAAHADILGPHWTERLDLALWNGWDAAARALMPRASAGWRNLAEARLALRALERGVDGRINAVPSDLRDDPGLAYERFLWRLRKDREEDAIALMLERSESAESLGKPEIWAAQRMRLARIAMQDLEGQRAYDLASSHHLSGGSQYAAFEWLAGYAALRQLNNPQRALPHFERFLAAVGTPISLGRAGYWLGRTYEALGDEVAAERSYSFGAEHQTSFYGLLAAERGGLRFDMSLAGQESFPPWRTSPFLQSDVFDAAILLLAAGEISLGERFLTHLAESLDRTQIGQMGDMLIEMRRPHLQVMLGKRAADAGIQIAGPYFALHPMAERDLPVPPELALAIARRESEFDPGVISPAGARGLMQVMPNTAQEVSTRLGLPYAQPKLTRDPDYNITLGTAYLAELIARYQGNPVLVAAAYNAGPSRPDAWIEELGDPRRAGDEIVDWIERIPFTETRNYVMRVTESLPIYRARLGLDPLPQPFSQLLTGSSLLARTP